MRVATICVALLLLQPCLAAPVVTVPVFKSGESGVAAFRIPGLLSFESKGSGYMLAYAEGRVAGCGDFSGTHTVVIKRSADRGRTWSPLSTIMDPLEMFGAAACPRTTNSGCEFWDPTAVFDRDTGDVLLLAALSRSNQSRMDAHMSMWMTRSSDAGLTWAAPTNLTSQLLNADGSMTTPGNGHAIQLASGRLLVSGYLRPAGDSSEHCVTLASDDHGKSWFNQLANLSAGDGTSECEATEISGAVGAPTLLMDERMNAKDQRTYGGCGEGVALCRWRSTSTDGGASWTGPVPQPALPDPSCAAGQAAWSTRGPTAMLFANSASVTARKNVTVRASLDGGKTWPMSQLVSGPGGYVDVQLVPADGRVPHDEAAVLYEVDSCGGLNLALVNLGALERGV